MEDNILYMERFCGMEEYPLKDSIWYILKGDGTEYDPDQLYLEMNFEKGRVMHEDTRFLDEEPFWNLVFYSFQMPDIVPQAGLCMEQPNERQDVYGNLYYGEHQPTMDNKMEILMIDGDRLKVRLTGVTEDVNYYDGSKPKSTLQITAWFNKK